MKLMQLDNLFFNIDKIDEKLLKVNPVNIKKYLSYKKRYLTSRNDNKTNCEIIIEDLLNYENHL